MMSSLIKPQESADDSVNAMMQSYLSEVNAERQQTDTEASSQTTKNAMLTQNVMANKLQS